MGPRLALVTSLMLLGVSAVGEAAQAQTFRLVQAAIEVDVSPYVVWDLQQKKPADFGPLPKLQSPQPWFAHLMLGDGKPVPVVIDIHPGDSKAPATLYVDSNADMSLADEQPVQASVGASSGTPRPFGPRCLTPVITVPVTYHLGQGKTVTRQYAFRFSMWLSGNRPYDVRMLPAHAWQGYVLIGNRRTLIALVDGNADAVYAPTASWHTDFLCMDLNGDGTFGEGPSERKPLTRFVDIENVLYQITVSRDGSEVTIAPYQGPQGKLVFWAKDGNGRPLQVIEVDLRGADYVVSRRGPITSLSLPPGSYTLSYRLAKSPESRTQYSLSVPGQIKVVAGQSKHIRCGLALEVVPQVAQRRLTSPKDAVQLDIQLTVRTKEEHHGFGRPTPPSSKPPAKVQVLDAKRNVVATTNAEYG